MLDGTSKRLKVNGINIFENRWSRCKAQAKINRSRTLCTVRINFCEATQQMPAYFQKIKEFIWTHIKGY